MWEPLERALTTVVSRPSPTTRRARANRRRASSRCVLHGLARQAVHVLDRSGFPRPTSSACRSEVRWRRSSPWPTRTGCGGWCSPRRMCGLGGVPGNPWRSDLLATPLRYYSPSFLRLTARRPLRTGERPRREVYARSDRRSPCPPTDACGVTSASSRDCGLDEPPVAAPHPAADPRPQRRSDPIVPPINARILARRIPNAKLEDRAQRRAPAADGARRRGLRADRDVPRSARTSESRRLVAAARCHDRLSSLRSSHDPDDDAGHPPRRPRARRDPTAACIDDDRLALTNAGFLARVERLAARLRVARHRPR